MSWTHIPLSILLMSLLLKISRCNADLYSYPRKQDRGVCLLYQPRHDPEGPSSCLAFSVHRYAIEFIHINANSVTSSEHPLFLGGQLIVRALMALP